MTKLHWNFKDVFRALRLGFSAKKVWMLSLGLLFGFTGYVLLTYLAYVAAGLDFLAVWQTYRLLPLPSPYEYAFPWYSWVVFGAGVLWFICVLLLSGTAVSKVAYEQLRGDEFFESKEAFRFAIKNRSAVLGSPLLILAFVALIVACGLLLSLLGAIPAAGEIIVGLLAVLGFIASLFIVYLLVVFFFSLLLGPSVVATTHSDTFDTLFEVFSCVNEQPARLLSYTATIALLGKAGSFLLGLATSAAGRIGYAILGSFMGEKLAMVMGNAAYYFKLAAPDWCPALLQQTFIAEMNLYGFPQVYLPGDYIALGWSHDVAALLLGVLLYLVAIMVVSYGLSVWFTGMTLNFAVLAYKKDEKNILELPEDDEELIEPVPNPELKDLEPKPVDGEADKKD
ncbi:hypothetical protein FJY68_08490 [candidate division WOR-3 bacterium]|uniref:Uncharacterized protein n=1 Tax=candidate division WOR-3 bacterium TaxID=2052148 RepID=A0A938BTQ5_UNCW3|nr:hypothetical protein [candidate division WOR-3 bacterium]